MSGPEAIRVDRANGRVEWEDGGSARKALVDCAVDARYDPEHDRLIVLTRAEERGAIAIVSRDGESVAIISPPEGYSLSHFAAVSEPVLVGQGEASDGGWWDWHFTVDEDGRALRRLGPAH
jgi:hypothetical protein